MDGCLQGKNVELGIPLFHMWIGPENVVEN